MAHIVKYGTNSLVEYGLKSEYMTQARPSSLAKRRDDITISFISVENQDTDPKANKDNCVDNTCEGSVRRGYQPSGESEE
jgi:hypothetical protein